MKVWLLTLRQEAPDSKVPLERKLTQADTCIIFAILLCEDGSNKIPHMHVINY